MQLVAITVSMVFRTVTPSDRKGQFSIRINDQYRVCFRWTDEGPTDVEIVDYH